MRSCVLSAPFCLLISLARALVTVPTPAAEPTPPAPPLIRIPFDAGRARSLQAEWARAFGLDREVTNSLGMKLVLIPGGRFDMGPGGSRKPSSVRMCTSIAAFDCGQRWCASSASRTASSSRPARRAMSAASTSRLGELRAASLAPSMAEAKAARDAANELAASS